MATAQQISELFGWNGLGTSNAQMDLTPEQVLALTGISDWNAFQNGTFGSHENMGWVPIDGTGAGFQIGPYTDWNAEDRPFGGGPKFLDKYFMRYAPSMAGAVTADAQADAPTFMDKIAPFLPFLVAGGGALMSGMGAGAGAGAGAEMGTGAAWMEPGWQAAGLGGGGADLSTAATLLDMGMPAEQVAAELGLSQADMAMAQGMLSEGAPGMFLDPVTGSYLPYGSVSSVGSSLGGGSVFGGGASSAGSLAKSALGALFGGGGGAGGGNGAGMDLGTFLASRIFANKADKSVGEDIDQMFNRLQSANVMRPYEGQLAKGAMDRFNTDYLSPRLDELYGRTRETPYQDLIDTSSNGLQTLYNDPMSNPIMRAVQDKAAESIMRKSAAAGRLHGGSMPMELQDSLLATLGSQFSNLANPMNNSFNVATDAQSAHQNMGNQTMNALSNANQANWAGAGTMVNAGNAPLNAMGNLATTALGNQIASNPWRSGLAGTGQNMGTNAANGGNNSWQNNLINTGINKGLDWISGFFD
jgi:hypothetical protein